MYDITEQKAVLLNLLKSIRSELKPGYTAAGWDNKHICVTHYPRPSDADSRVRYFVRNTEEWTALKARLF